MPTGPHQAGRTTLAREGLVVMYEVQRRPDLVPVLPVLAYRRTHNASFLIQGSASRDLLRQSRDLTGRAERIEIRGFTPAEV